MSGLLVNIVLAIAWVMVTGTFNFSNLFIGMGLGYAILALTQTVSGKPRYARRLLSVAWLMGFFIYELVLANIRLAIDVLFHWNRIRPAMFTIPLDARTDFEIAAFANLIALTPGSTVIAVSEDRKSLLIHLVDAGDAEIAVIMDRLKRGFETRVLDVTR